MTALAGSFGRVVTAIAGSDCEALDPGTVAQPFNTWSSAAYVVAGMWIVARRHRWHLDRTAAVFGLLVISVGVGSIAFHGAADAIGRWIHDVGFLGLLGFVAGWHLAPLARVSRDRRGSAATVTAAGVVLVAGILLVPFPDATNPVAALLVVLAAVGFVAQRARARTRLAWSDAPFVIVGAAAGAAFWLGRSGSPACDPGSWFQFHGLWHVATAVLAVVWARGALSARGRGEGAARDGADRFLARVAGLVVKGFFREVTVSGAERVPQARPVLIVVNHFNGLVDPIVAVHALGRLPRFIAKATLWKTKAARPFLGLAGLIPVYRTVDREVDGRDPAAGNTSAFVACHEVLAKGGTVAIFPEGTTSARSRLEKVKTGAARIALGAYAQGTRDVVVVPMGIAYEDRVAFRGRAYIEIGPPIVVADEIAGLFPPGQAVTEDDRGAVDRLTDEVDARLRACGPDYQTPREEATLQMAAKVALRPQGDDGS